MAYRIIRMAHFPVTFSDFEGQLLFFETFLSHIFREIQRVLSTICLHMNQKERVACNFNYLFENKGLLKIPASHVYRYCKCGNISETVPDSVAVTIQPTNRK